MATIEKRGDSYRIRASSGYAVNGKQVRPSITWTPDPGMSEQKIKKELAKRAARFEDQIQNNKVVDSRMKFAKFSEKFMEDYGSLKLHPKTQRTYTENLVKINAAIGHIKLCELKTSHINAFYKNLQEEGVRGNALAVSKIDLSAYLKEHKMSIAKLASMSGVSRPTVKAAVEQNNISKESAEKIASALGVKPASMFEMKYNTQPLAPATVLAFHRTLNSILSKAVQWGYIENNPAARAEKPKLDRKESPYLEEEDARRLLVLLQSEPIKWRALITFDLLSGLRRGELLGLRWVDVDIENQMVYIRQTSNYLPKRGVYTSAPKTDSSRRPLKLARAAMLLLLEYKDWQEAQKTALGDAWEDQDGRVFTTDSGAPIFPDSVTQWFTQFVKRNNLPKVTVHSLRHTYASLLIADGTPLVVVSRQLGHAQTSTTANIYAHVISAAETKAIESMDNKFQDLVVLPSKTKKAVGG